MKNTIIALIALFGIMVQAQNTNTATVSGNWSNCTTWNNPINLYNTQYDYKIISPGVTVLLDTPFCAKKVTLGSGSILNLSNYKLDFSHDGSGTSCSPTISGVAVVDKIIVNFSETVAAKSLSGFLFGLSTEGKDRPDALYQNYPIDDVQNKIMPLKPKLFRQNDSLRYQDSYDIAGRVHMVLSDSWYQTDTIRPLPGSNTTTNSWAVYRTLLDSWFTWGQSKPGIVWECWNEANVIVTPWLNPANTATRIAFYDTYKEFFLKLIQYFPNRLPGANQPGKAAGPSFSYFDPDFMKEFFDYCVLNGVEVNVVTWHEFDVGNNSIPFTKLKEHVQYVRDHFMNNPKYASLKMETIEINEMVYKELRHNPAVQAAYLSNLEQAGVDYACKSCWASDYDPVGSCKSSTFNNLFTRKGKKRPNWGVYKLYADGVPGRVKSINETGKSFSIANTIATGTPAYKQVLFGYYDYDTATELASPGMYSIRLNNVGAANASYKIYMRKIPYILNDEDAELAHPLTISIPGITNNTVTLDANGGYTLTFQAEKENVYQLTLSTGIPVFISSPNSTY